MKDRQAYSFSRKVTAWSHKGSLISVNCSTTLLTKRQETGMLGIISVHYFSGIVTGRNWRNITHPSLGDVVPVS